MSESEIEKLNAMLESLSRRVTELEERLNTPRCEICGRRTVDFKEKPALHTNPRWISYADGLVCPHCNYVIKKRLIYMDGSIRVEFDMSDRLRW